MSRLAAFVVAVVSLLALTLGVAADDAAGADQGSGGIPASSPAGEPAEKLAPGFGKRLPLSALNRSQAGTIQSLVNAAPYYPRPGDVFVLSVASETSSQQDTGVRFQAAIPVEPDRTMQVPYLGRVDVRSVDYLTLRRTVIERIKPVASTELVSFEFQRPASFEVSIGGGVPNPGVLIANPFMRLADALMIAGGLQRRGSYREIQLHRSDGGRLIVDISKYPDTGAEEDNPHLAIGDRIFVPPAGIQVWIQGPVGAPGIYEVLPHESLAHLLAMAGGLLPAASSAAVELSRRGEDGSYTIEYVFFADWGTALLRDGDVLVLHSGSWNSPIVTVEGALFGSAREGVGRVGMPTLVVGGATAEAAAASLVPATQIPWPVTVRLSYFRGMTMEYVLEQLGGPTPFAKRNASLIIRGQELIPFDVFALWEQREKARSIPLEPGDVVRIPMEPVVVTLVGQVAVPGAVPAQLGEPLSTYVFLRGGPTVEASTTRIYLVDEAGRRIRKVGLDYVPRGGDIIAIERQAWVILRDSIPIVASVVSLVTSVVGLVAALLQ